MPYVEVVVFVTLVVARAVVAVFLCEMMKVAEAPPDF